MKLHRAQRLDDPRDGHSRRQGSAVNRYIDLVLAAETPETQRAFLNSLGYLDGESMRRSKAAFRYVSREEQNDLLHGWRIPHGSGWAGDTNAVPDPGHAHFEALKRRIMTAYYSSQIGERSSDGRRLCARQL